MVPADSPAIDATMSVRQVCERYPETVDVFERHRLGCAGCDAALFESIAQAAAVHGVALDALVTDLNEALRR
jgi:hybrid cluster-associated redox disulfide protein